MLSPWSNASGSCKPKLWLEFISRERVGRNLDEASRIARAQQSPQAIVASELAITKVFGLAKAGEQYNPIDPSNAQSMSDIGRLLLESVGAKAPSQAAISLAIEANNQFIERLEQIAAKDQGGSVSANSH